MATYSVSTVEMKTSFWGYEWPHSIGSRLMYLPQMMFRLGLYRVIEVASDVVYIMHISPFDQSISQAAINQSIN